MTSSDKEDTCFTVSSLGNETMKQLWNERNTVRNNTETTSLKSLCLLVLERNRQQNNQETTVFQEAEPKTVEISDILTDYVVWYEERAAIYQYDGGCSQIESEWHAMNDTIERYRIAYHIAADSDLYVNFMLKLHALTGFNHNQREKFI